MAGPILWGPNNTANNLQSNLSLPGSTSGAVTITTQTASGTYNFNLPTTAGSSGQALTSAGGGSSPMTWASVLSNPMTTEGDLIYGASSGAATRLPAGSAGQVLISDGTSGPPAWTTLTAPTKQIFTSTGSTTGYWFVTSSANATVGATYTNNGNTYTVLSTIASSVQLFVSGASAPTTSGTLTKASGTGDSTITFSANTPLATYTTPAGATLLKVTLIGGGGGGGGSATVSSSNIAAGAGGGGGGSVISYISSPISTMYYSVGTAGSGGSAGNNAGAAGIQSTFNVTLLAGGGHGGGGGGSAAAVTTSSSGTGGTAAGGNINVPGGNGLNGLYLAAGVATPGGGGGSLFAPICPSTSGSVTSAGQAGLNYGGGGGGGVSVSSGTQQAGGNGSSGVIIIEEFYQ